MVSSRSGLVASIATGQPISSVNLAFKDSWRVGLGANYRVDEQWTLRFGTEYARRLRRRRGACSNIWHLDELCLMINGDTDVNRPRTGFVGVPGFGGLLDY